MTASKHPPVKSAARALEILEYFARIRRPASLKEIITDLRYPQSSSTFLLKSLIAMGYLNYNRAGRTYFPTFKVTLLGDWLTTLIDDDLKDLLRRIQAETGETVLLAVQNDIYVQYLDVIDSNHEMRFHVEKGGLIPLTQTSLGWLILSRKTNLEVEKLCRQINAKLADPSKQVDVAKFVAQIEKLRSQDHCYVPNLPMRAGGCISMQLPLEIAGQPAVIGTGGLVDRLNENEKAILNTMRRQIQAFGKAHRY